MFEPIVFEPLRKGRNLLARPRNKSVRCVDANISNILRNSYPRSSGWNGIETRGSTNFCDAFPRKLARNLADDRIIGGVQPRVRTRWKEISSVCCVGWKQRSRRSRVDRNMGKKHTRSSFICLKVADRGYVRLDGAIDTPLSFLLVLLQN